MDVPDADQPEQSRDHPHSIKRGLYADMLLTSEKGAKYDEVIKGLRQDFAVTSNVDEMHLQLTAVCYLKLANRSSAMD